MAITVSQKENINQMDIRHGGIYSEKARVTARKNPMLVVGLGGTGIDAMLRLKNLIGRRFDMPLGENGKRLESPYNIRFLGFETCVEDIRTKEYNGTKLNENREYQNLSEPGLNEILQSPDTRIPGYIKDWLDNPVRLRNRVKGGTTGANGVRQGGRLLLSLKLNEIVANLTNIIHDLLSGTDAQDKLEVFVLTGISGGTGSGIFIDVPYIIRGLMESGGIVANGSDRLDIISYIFTPDVLISKVTDGGYHNVLAINGFAALKELDYLMNIEQRGERFVQQYGPNLTVNTPKPPFSLCHLISATGTNGFKPNNPYDYCMNIAAEHIVNFMSNMLDENGNIFGVHAYRANIDTAIGSMMTNFRPKYSANFIYNVLGASAFELPQIDIMTYLAFKLFEKLHKMYDNKPTEQEVNEYASAMGLTLDMMDADFDSDVAPPLQKAENKPQYGDDSILQNEERLMLDCTTWVNNAAAEYDKKYLNLKTVKVSEVERDYIHRIFCDPEKGPFYAQFLIYNTGNFNLLNSLLSFRHAAEVRLKEYPSRIQSANDEILEKRSIFKKAILNKNQKRLDFINAHRKLARLMAEQKKNEYLIRLYDDMHKGLMELNSRVYSTFTDVLRYLYTIFEKNGSILTGASQELFNMYDNADTYTWKLFDVKNKNILAMLDKALEAVNIDNCIKEVTSKMLDDSERWLKEGSIDIASFFNEFITFQFAEIATKTMDEYLFTMFKDPTSIKQHVKNVVVPELARHAKPMYPTSAAALLTTLPSWKMIVLPRASASVIQAFSEVAQIGQHGLRHQHILKSDVAHRIYWLNLEVGMPMCWHAGMNSYEEKYTRVILANDELSIGCHLYQSEKCDWRKLPSPISDLSWDSTYKNAYVLEANNQKRALFDKAFEYGIIKIVDRACYLYFAAGFTADDIAGVVPQKDVSAITSAQARTYIQKLNAYLEQWSDEQAVVKTGVFASTLEGADIQAGYRESFTRCFEMWDKTEGEIEKYEEIQRLLELCNEAVKRNREREQSVTLFTNALFTGAIKRGSGVFKYDNDDSEPAWNILNTAKIKDPDEAMFPEFALFREFNALEPKKRNLIVNKSDKRLDNIDNTMVAAANKFHDIYRAQKLRLDNDEVDVSSDELRDEIYQFYIKVMNIFDNKIKMLED